MRVNLFLNCGSCAALKKKHRNYLTSKAKKPQGDKLSLKKYCKFCRKIQIHEEEIVKKSKT